MEETTIVIMLKDEETGFLDKELGSYSVPERAELIWSIYVKSNEEGHCDPVWIVGFPFIEDQDAMEGKLAEILQAHEKELCSVFDAIKDKEDDYREE